VIDEISFLSWGNTLLYSLPTGGLNVLAVLTTSLESRTSSRLGEFGLMCCTED